MTAPGLQETEIIDGALPEQAAEEVALLLREEAVSDQRLGYHDFDYQAGFGAILGDRLRHLILRGAAGVVGYMPWREKDGPHGTIANALPFFGPNGLIFATSEQNLGTLTAAFRRAITRPEVLSAVIYTPFRADPAPIADALQPHFRLPRVTQYLDLSNDEPWPQSRRWDIAKAERAGFEFGAATARDLEPLYAIYRDGCLAVGIPMKPFAYFQLTQSLAERGRPDSPLWLAARLNGEIVAGLLVMRGPRVASYTIPIASAAVRSHQPMALLIDRAAAICRRDGQRYWNFESSPAVGDPVYRFKQRWGAVTAPYEVQGLYPNGTASVHSLSRAELAVDYPFYFAYPFAPSDPSARPLRAQATGVGGLI